MKQKIRNEMMGLVFYHAHFGTHTHLSSYCPTECCRGTGRVLMVSHSAHTSTHHFSVCATLREALLIISQRKKGRKGERNKNNIKTCSSAYLIKLATSNIDK